MATTGKQSPESSESSKRTGKRRRKGEAGPGKVLRDFLQRTGLNDDLEELVAHVARQGIKDLWKTFTPTDGSQPVFNLPPDQPFVEAKGGDPDDPYVVLGVHRNTPPEIMKAVYLAWAKNHHPDVGGDSETFKRVNVAWDKIKEERGF